MSESHEWDTESEYDGINLLAVADAEIEAATDPATLPEVVRRKLLAVRDALAAEDAGEAYHQLYSIACPGFGELDPWAKLEGR